MQRYVISAVWIWNRSRIAWRSEEPYDLMHRKRNLGSDRSLQPPSKTGTIPRFGKRFPQAVCVVAVCLINKRTNFNRLRVFCTVRHGTTNAGIEGLGTF